MTVINRGAARQPGDGRPPSAAAQQSNAELWTHVTDVTGAPPDVTDGRVLMRPAAVDSRSPPDSGTDIAAAPLGLRRRARTVRSAAGRPGSAAGRSDGPERCRTVGRSGALQDGRTARSAAGRSGGPERCRTVGRSGALQDGRTVRSAAGRTDGPERCRTVGWSYAGRRLGVGREKVSGWAGRGRTGRSVGRAASDRAE